MIVLLALMAVFLLVCYGEELRQRRRWKRRGVKYRFGDKWFPEDRQ